MKVQSSEKSYILKICLKTKTWLFSAKIIPHEIGDVLAIANEVLYHDLISCYQFPKNAAQVVFLLHVASRWKSNHQNENSTLRWIAKYSKLNKIFNTNFHWIN